MTDKRRNVIRIVRLGALILLSAPVAYGLAHLCATWLDDRPPQARDDLTLAGAFQQGGEAPLSKQNPPSPENFRPRQVVREFAPITKIPTMSVEQAKGRIDDAELVLGVEIDGQARAYPINMLTGPSREIFNDQLAGAAIAATW